MIPESVTLVFLGRSGCGKDTQIDFLLKRPGFAGAVKIVMGDIFRDIAKSDSLLGRRVRKVIETGGLLPVWIEIYALVSALASKVMKDEILILDGTRRLEEAKILDEALKFVGRPGAVGVLLKISPEESMRRLLGRGRADDREERIKNRLHWFETEVTPTIEHYRLEKRLVEVKGEGTREEIFQRLQAGLEQYFE